MRVGAMTWTRTSTTVALCLLSIAVAAAQGPASRPLSPAEELELKTLAGQLADTARAEKTKQEAAELMLVRPYPQAAEALKQFLSDSSNRPAQIAIAQAIARHGSDQAMFVDPLLAMLTGSESSVRDVAGRALAACRTCGGTDRLMEISASAKHDKAVRLVAIASLHRVLDKQVVDSLIRLLDDDEPAIRIAASDALGKLTNIRAFGASRTQWKQWWQQNMNKDRTQWLADLADSLGQSKAALEVENARLRTRLAKGMIDLFTATPAAQRDAMLIGFLKDPLADVRLVGLELLGRSIDGGAAASSELCQQVKMLLTDTDEPVRQESAKVLAVTGDAEAMNFLVERLKVETAPAVRQGILMALGQLHDSKSMPSVLAEVNSRDEDVAAAAAMAVGRIVSKAPPEEADRRLAISAITDRYSALGKTAAETPLREALLAAMGDLAEKNFIPMLEAALQDEAATVRLAAVSSLSKLGATASAAAVEKLVTDNDRGVRGAALAALRTLDGLKYLQVILQRTDSAAEVDAANRQQAWDLVMGILAKADAKVLADVADKLASRQDAVAQRIKVLQMLAALMKDSNDLQMPSVLRQVGLVLAKNDRHAEACPYLADAYKAMAAAQSPECQAAWLEWVDAMLAADDPSAVKELAAQSDNAQFCKAMEYCDARLADMDKKGRWQSMIILTSELGKQISDRLSADQRKGYQELQTKAKAAQAAADRQRVGKLLAVMGNGDEAARKAAAADIQAMGDRSIDGLLQELKANLEADATNAPAEQNAIDMLRLVAPKLTGYDAAGPKDAKLKLVAGWMASPAGAGR